MGWELSKTDRALILLALYLGANYERNYADALRGSTSPDIQKIRESLKNANDMDALANRLAAGT